MQILRNVFHWIKIVVRAIMLIAVILLALYNVYMLIQRYAYGNGMPTVFGYGTAVVVSGSMDTGENPETDIRINDLVIVKAQDSYEVNDVITFYDSSSGTYITHRITLVSAEGTYATKGDANDAEDNFSVKQAAVVGKVVNVIRGGGNVIAFLQSPLGLLAVLGGGVVVWLLMDVITSLCKKSDQEKEHEQQKD